MTDDLHALDPLAAVSEQQRILFKRFTTVAHGFNNEDVVGAAVNMLVNAVRQSQVSRPRAERAYDDFAARGKQMLADSYSNGERKKGVYAYHQIIHIPTFDFSLK